MLNYFRKIILEKQHKAKPINFNLIKKTLGELPPGSKTVNGFLIANFFNNCVAFSAVHSFVLETSNLIDLLKAWLPLNN